jgi:hypothetical protein
MTTPILPVTLCSPHVIALLAAGRGCGCSTEVEQWNFVADMLEASLYYPVRAFVGDDIVNTCVVCAYAFEGEAIDDAVVQALALRARYGVVRRLN